MRLGLLLMCLSALLMSGVTYGGIRWVMSSGADSGALPDAVAQAPTPAPAPLAHAPASPLAPAPEPLPELVPAFADVTPAHPEITPAVATQSTARTVAPASARVPSSAHLPAHHRDAHAHRR